MAQKGNMILEGVRILDLTRFFPGPYCAMILADLGADVIKIEEPRVSRPSNIASIKEIDWTKNETERQEIFTAYDFVNRNKRSICLNLKHTEGRSLFYKMSATADIVIEDFRPGVTKRLGIDYEEIRSINPGIIYCSITGYGQDGPYSNLPGFDSNFMGLGGVLGLTGTTDGRHVLPGIPFADLGGGMQGAIGILGAIISRNKTGEGQYVDIAITDSVVQWITIVYGKRYFATLKQPKMGEGIPHIYETKDKKYILVNAIELDRLWEGLCKVLGLEEYIPCRRNIQFFDPQNEELPKIVNEMANILRTKDRDEWIKLLEPFAVTAVYKTFDDVFSDPQVVHRDMIVELKHSHLGKVKQPGFAIKFSDTPGVVRRLPPSRGENTREILAELGYTGKEIELFREKSIIE